MKRFVGIALGTAIGTLLYTCLTYFNSNGHQFDWGRAMFVGSFVSLAGMVLPMTWPKKKRKQ